MLGHESNPMLQQAEDGIRAKVPPAQQADLDRVVHAGLTIMYSPKLAEQRNARIAQTTDAAADAGQGAARMILNLYQQSGKKMPTELVVPASMILAMEYLDLVAQAGKAQITPDLIAKATQATADAVLPLMGITKDKVAALVAQAQQGAQGGAQGGAQAAPTQAPQGIIAAAQGA